MKIILLLVICISCCIKLSAQSSFIIGANSGVNTTWIIYQDIYGEINDNGVSHQLKYKLTARPALGLQAGYAFSSSWAVYLKPLYSWQGQNYKTGVSTRDTSYAITRQVYLNYLKLPIETEYTFGNDNTNFYIAGGLQIGYLKQAAIAAQYYGVSSDGNHNSADAFKRYKRIDPGLVIEAGSSFLLTGGLYFDAGIRSDISVSDINSAGYHIPNAHGVYHHSYNNTNGIQIGIHYLFNNNSEF